MGWSIGFDTRWNRDIGYGVSAYCDFPGCMAEIDRGLSHVCCGEEPHGGDNGCGLYFCDEHHVYFRNGQMGACSRCHSYKEPFSAHAGSSRLDSTQGHRSKLGRMAQGTSRKGDGMRIYVAGPLFTSAERLWNARLARLLEQAGHEVWLPQEKESRDLTAKNIFDMDVAGVDWAQIVVGIMDGPDPDSGTSWECGYAYKAGKPIILIRTDFRGSGEGNLSPYNLMLSQSCTARFELPFADVEAVAKKISVFLTGDSNGR